MTKTTVITVQCHRQKIKSLGKQSMNTMDENGEDERAADKQDIRAKHCEWPMCRRNCRKRV